MILVGILLEPLFIWLSLFIEKFPIGQQCRAFFTFLKHKVFLYTPMKLFLFFFNYKPWFDYGEMIEEEIQIFFLSEIFIYLS